MSGLHHASGATPRLRLVAAAVFTAALLAVACEEALVYEDVTGLSGISLEDIEVPDTVTVGQQAIATAAVIDSASGGRVVGVSSIQWVSSDTSVLRIVGSESGDSIRFETRRPGIATITASVDTLPFRTSSHDELVVVVLSAVVSANTDSTVSALGDTVVVTASGLGMSSAVPNSGLSWTIRGSGALERIGTGPADQIRVEAVGVGTDTIEVTHLLCAGACIDEIVITVTQHPDRVEASRQALAYDALLVDSALTAAVLDRRGHPIQGAALTWSLAEPADSATIGLSPTGTVRSRGNGSALVVVSHAGLSDTVDVTVAQSAASVDIGLDSVRFNALDLDSALTARVRDRNLQDVVAPATEWMSRASGVASVDAGGLVTAHATGSTWIVASSGNARDSVRVSVGQIVTDVAVGLDTVAFTALDAIVDLDAQAFDANLRLVPGRPQTWQSRSSSVASVDAGGIVTAIGVGSTFVVVTVDGASDSAFVSVMQVVDSVDAVPPALTLHSIGETAGLVLNAFDANGNPAPGTTSWTSRAPATASIHPATGLITAAAEGTTWVIGTTGGLSDSTLVTVDQLVVAFTVTPDSVEIVGLGETTQLAITGAVDAMGVAAVGSGIWLSRAPSIASVDANGLVQAVSVGSTWVVASIDGATDSAHVTVEEPVRPITLDADTARLVAIDDTATLTFVALDGNGDPIAGSQPAWTSRDTTIVTVADGLVTAVRVGGTWVVAALNGGTDSAFVEVTQVVASVEISPASISFMTISRQVSATAVARDATGHDIAATRTWLVRSPNVASVTAAGLVEAEGPGSTWLVVNVAGVLDSIPIVVNQVVATVVVAPGSRSAGVGDTIHYSATPKDSASFDIVGRTVTWGSSDNARASIQSNGIAAAHSVGTVVISAIIDGVDGAATLNISPYAPAACSTPTTILPQSTYSTNQTWTAANSPYRLAGTVTVNAGATLTVQPGTLVCVGTGFGIDFSSGGRLSAIGTAAAPIMFRPVTETAAWDGLSLLGTASASVIRHTWFEGGGLFSGVGHPLLVDTVTVIGAEVVTSSAASILNQLEGGGAFNGVVIHGGVLRNSVIRGSVIGVDVAGNGAVVEDVRIENTGVGMYFRGDNVTLTDVLIIGFDSIGIFGYGGPSVASITGLTVTGGDGVAVRGLIDAIAALAPTSAAMTSYFGNAIDSLEVIGGTLPVGDSIQLDGAYPLKIANSFTVAGTMIMVPGVALAFPAGTGITFTGPLLAEGNFEDFHFRARNAGERWAGFTFSGTPSSGSRLHGAEFFDVDSGAVHSLGSHPVELYFTNVHDSYGTGLILTAPGTFAWHATVNGTQLATAPGVVLGGNAIFDASSVSGAAGTGVYVTGTDVRFYDAVIANNAGVGLEVADTATVGFVSELYIYGNAYPARLPIRSLAGLLWDPYGGHYTGNDDDAIRIRPSTLTGMTLRLPATNEYLLEGIVTIGSGATLIVDPGVIVRAAGANSAISAQLGGRVLAQGTAAEPITFTSTCSGCGWSGIKLGDSPSDTSRFSNVRIEYASEAIYGGPTHPVVIDSTLIRQSWSSALNLSGPGSRIMRSTIDTVQLSFSSSDAGVIVGANGQVMEDVTIRGVYGGGDGPAVRIGNFGGGGIRIERCTITESTGNGIEVYFAPGVLITGCNLVDNGGLGITGGTAIMAENNWWGDPAGPNGPAGDGVGGDVDFDPFLTAPATVNSYRP